MQDSQVPQVPYDILIVGAGPAGCAAAYDLARAGQRVLLLDKRTFPRHKACACGLTRKTLNALRYSVDPIVERVCHEIVLQHANPSGSNNSGAPEPALSLPKGFASGTWVSTSVPMADKTQEVRVKTRNRICALAVRERFDHFCLQQTLASARNGGSVELRKIDRIAVLRESATGIELVVVTPSGVETLRSPVLIGADGSNSQTRRLAEHLAASPAVNPDAAANPGALGLHSETWISTESHASQPPPDPTWYLKGFALEATVPYSALPAILPAGAAPHDLVFDFAPLPGGYGWLFPKGDHINIGVGAFAPRPATNPGAPRLAPETWALQDASLKQVTRALLLTYAQQKLGVTTLAHITGQQLGMGGHTYIPRGRILLVGDAAGLVDPLTGEGIHSAIVSGQAAAAAILSCADGERKNSTSPGSPYPASGTWDELATLYAKNLRPLQQTLAFSHRAARAFYAQPERGFKAMRIPILRSLILKTYADGLPHTKLLTTLARLLT
jgi:flavin-dependent dehydrogenase